MPAAAPARPTAGACSPPGPTAKTQLDALLRHRQRQKLWSYPDNFVGVHGSHKACPPAEGMVRGSFGPCGTAKLPPPMGNVWVLATNVGEWHIMTENGLYLTRLFQGDPMQVRWPDEGRCRGRHGQCSAGHGRRGFRRLDLLCQ